MLSNVKLTEARGRFPQCLFRSLSAVSLSCVCVSKLSKLNPMARTAVPRSSLPLDSWAGHRRSTKRKPAHEKYSSMQHFFNDKRHQLLRSLPPTDNFNERIVPETRGELISPSPPGSARKVLTEEGARLKRSKISGRGGKKQNTPQYQLAKRQLKNMWNAKPTTKEQEIEREQATPKMRAFNKTYRLKEFGRMKTDNNAAKKAAERGAPDQYDNDVRSDIERAIAMVRAEAGWIRRLPKRKRCAIEDGDNGNEEHPYKKRKLW